MPREKENTSAAAEPVESEKQVVSGEKVDLDEDNDPEENMEEEYEYEEVEEEEEEEIEEEVEEVVEEEDEDDHINANEVDAQKSSNSDDAKFEDEDEKEKHAELLALPPHGSEVYIGGIPHDGSEDELRRFCETVGEVTEVRIMKGKDSSENKGFAFVTFRNVELATKAIDELNNTEFKGKKIRCSTSQAKHRLFIGNIPRNWGLEDLKKVVYSIGPGVTGVELVKDMKSSGNNRGFAFIEYHNHACAEYSRQKMMNPQFKLGSNAPTVSWADPRNADSSGASQVKAVYVKNLPKNVTQDQLKKLFEHHGKITKVVLPPAKSGQEKNRIGFVHFVERSSAMKALKNTEKYELDGQVLECSLAKPQADQKSTGGPVSQKPSLLQSYPPHIGYGLAAGAYGALGAGFGAAPLAQPMIYGRGPTPAGMAMMPMLLPDGRIGYVLQQPGAQPHSLPAHHRNSSRSSSGGGNKSGGSSSRGRHGNDGGRGQRYRPY
ncbi:heterogeneous nuclear ribonucleoprotein Q-like [Mangifera indica]|uniref:heterogeneous nuclear ribonucleoprotein Q-like n=1 Tax=Mangifera indica TaxID=29780 RepID=UPI001CFBA8B4|nr:heterogeneous nuclear ribonucleoprotein Q-like [Mangifera indica]XP_044506319.1 heterogeneous nuclear ribonucleoprotein Q-like [Mangifera indica]XP_044506320.1 heterogeneous nuclear ribonucleoprotein Q-like [Mangifera indica]